MRARVEKVDVLGWNNSHTLIKKCIHASETLSCTIRECAIVCNFLHVTSTCPFIYLCSGDAKFKWTLQVWHSSLQSLKVNCVPTSAENISKSHHPNPSILPNLDWNISILSITSSVVIFPYHKVLEFWSRHQQLKDNYKKLCHL